MMDGQTKHSDRSTRLLSPNPYQNGGKVNDKYDTQLDETKEGSCVIVGLVDTTSLPTTDM